MKIFLFFHKYLMGKIRFIKTTSEKLLNTEVVKNELGDDYGDSIIHTKDTHGEEDDKVIDNNLYIGDDRITDNFNIGDLATSTPTRSLGSLQKSTLGDLKKKSVSEILIDMLKATGSGDSELSKYSIPIMTDEMAGEATEDSDVDFDESEYTYIHIDEGDSDDPYIHIDDPFEITKTKEDVYLRMFHDMTGVIRNLQMEISRLKNLFDFGVYSYNDGNTYKSRELKDMDDSGVPTTEPLWAIDTCGLSIIEDSSVFNTLLDRNNKFIPIGGTAEEVFQYPADGQIKFMDGGGKFYDGNEENAPYNNLTLYKLTDSKLITYLVTDSPNVTLHLIEIPDNAQDLSTSSGQRCFACTTRSAACSASCSRTWTPTMAGQAHWVRTAILSLSNV